MQHIDLFSGIGGFSLASDWMRWKTIQFCEIDKFCQKVLKKHWSDVPIHDDIYTLTDEQIKNNKLYDKNKPTIITGGFPCQPFSQAGKRQGTKDDRYLWPEMLRIIHEVHPTWVVGENVAGLISMENGKTLERILTDLENEAYKVEIFIIPACAIGAWHRRDRSWIIANTSSTRRTRNGSIKINRCDRNFGRQESKILQKDVPNTDNQRLQGHRGLKECSGQWVVWKGDQPLKGIWQSEPNVGRVAHGISQRVDRLKSLGNAIVPQVAYEIFKAINQITNK